MHEVHIVREVAVTVEKQAKAQQARRVNTIRLKFNPLVSHSADHVQFCFDVVKKEYPVLENAVLVLNRVPGLVKCEKCGHEFEVPELPNLCPKCDSIQLKALHATHLELEGFDADR